MRRWVAGSGVAVLLLAGYVALDSADIVPGVLTTRPAPPPTPTETSGTRTLPVVPQPTRTTPVGMPLGPLAGAKVAPSAAGMRAALAPVVASRALAQASLVVRDGQSGAVLYDHAGSARRIPASTAKLLSAAAIGQAFDYDETLQTRVVRGSAAGQIVLVAGGDSLLAPGAGEPTAVAGRAGLGDLAGQVATRLAADGTRAVTLTVDTTYAAGPPLASTWPRSFRPEGITGAVAMLGRSDQRARPGRPGPADPLVGARDRFASLLRKHGVKVTEKSGPAAAWAETDGSLGVVESAPVREQMALALTDSDNALTEILARQGAARSGGGTEFKGTGAWVVRQVKGLGVDTTGVTLQDASGLSRGDRVTARMLTDVLMLGHDGRHPFFTGALAGLPIGGLTGTLEDRFAVRATHDAAGRARAKTGTLTGANGLAGTVVDEDGRLLVVAGLVARTGTNEAKAALDQVMATIAGCGCR